MAQAICGLTENLGIVPRTIPVGSRTLPGHVGSRLVAIHRARQTLKCSVVTRTLSRDLPLHLIRRPREPDPHSGSLLASVPTRPLCPLPLAPPPRPHTSCGPTSEPSLPPPALRPTFLGPQSLQILKRGHEDEVWPHLSISTSVSHSRSGTPRRPTWMS